MYVLSNKKASTQIIKDSTTTTIIKLSGKKCAASINAAQTCSILYNLNE